MHLTPSTHEAEDSASAVQVTRNVMYVIAIRDFRDVHK